MDRVSVVLVGIGGYGAFNYRSLTRFVDEGEYEIRAIVDPFAEKSEVFEEIFVLKILVYNTLEEFYEKDSAALAIISTPISLHKEQVITALKNNSCVLCEKPLAPRVQDVEEIIEACNKYKKAVGVGFQWSFSGTMLSLKRDILSGVLGKPLSFKTIVCWPRADEYYTQSFWRGRELGFGQCNFKRYRALYLQSSFFSGRGDFRSRRNGADFRANLQRQGKRDFRHMFCKRNFDERREAFLYGDAFLRRNA